MKRFLVMFFLFVIACEQSMVCMRINIPLPKKSSDDDEHGHSVPSNSFWGKFLTEAQASDDILEDIPSAASSSADTDDAALATIKSIAELETLYNRHQDEDVVVVTDLDNTCVQPLNIWARPEAFAWVRSRYHKILRGIPEPQRSELAHRRAVEFSLKHLRKSPLQCIERRTIAFFAELQHRGVPVFALTAREATEAERTAEQLSAIISPRSRKERLILDFSRSSEIPDIADLGRPIPARFYRGITCGGKNDKGELLCDFLAQLGIHPECVLFIDDQLGNCRSVLKALQKRGIRGFCRLYTHLDQATRKFTMQVKRMTRKEFPIDLRLDTLPIEWGRNCVSPVPGQTETSSAIIEKDRPSSR